MRTQRRKDDAGGDRLPGGRKCRWFDAQRLAMVALALFPVVLGSQQSPCDRELEERGSGPLGYRLRGNRCEGVYSRPVAGTTFYLVSFTEFLEDYDPLSGQPLHVTWSAPGGASVHLRSEAIERRLYYRMDAVRPPDSTVFEWPTAILGTLGIAHSDIGVLGWTTLDLGGVERVVHLPLRITQRREAVACGRYRLLLWPGVRLREVYLSVASVDPGGATGEFITRDEPLRYGYYPAERAIDLELPGLDSAGIYYLEVSADLRDGSTQTIEYWIYHAGPSAACGG